MHITDVTMFYAPGSGGVRTYVEAKRHWLADQPGIRHTLVVPGNSRCRENGLVRLPAPAIPFGHGYRFPVARRLWRCELIAIAPDVFEAGDPYLPAWATLDAARELGVPVVGVYHSDLPRLVGSRTGRWASRWLDAYVRRLYGRFDRVLAPSTVMANKLRALGVTEVFVQPLGVDIDRFHPARRDPGLRGELGLPDQTRLLIFAGRGSIEKNLPVLFKAMERLGEKYRLILVGSHLPRRTPDNVIVWPQFVDHQVLSRLLASVDALVHAGDRETFGLVVLEAMASGLPVVGVKGGAIPELVAPGCGLLAAPHDPEALAMAVRELFAAGPRAMGRAARHHVERHYAWSRVLPSLLNHYRELCGAGDVVFEPEQLGRRAGAA